MNSTDSISSAQIRRDSWRRRHDRRNATVKPRSMTVAQPPASLTGLLVQLSRGSISAEAARDIVAIAKGETTVEILIDAETGLVERWSMRTGLPSRKTAIRGASAA